MPVNSSLAKKLIKQYGYVKGMKIYYAMENENKPAYQKGMKTAESEGHTQKHFPKRRKKKTK
jgi:hypothetical protein